MGIKWLNENNLKPELILEKIESSKIANADGSISFNGFSLFENKIVLASMLNFGEHVNSELKAYLVGRAISECGQKKLTCKIFLNCINELLKKTLSTHEQEFQLLTTISIAKPFLFKKINFNGCTIRFHERSYPKPHKKAREELLRDQRLTETNKIGICYVTVSTKHRVPSIAADLCLNTINLFRAFLCLELNSNLTISFGSGEPKPINRIRLGKYHSLHFKDGKLATETIWYEPHHIVPDLYKIKDKERTVLGKNIRFLVKQIETLPFKKAMLKALIRFANAFDHTDHHSTIVMAWASLESLATSGKEQSSDKISKRCSFLFQDPYFHRQIIEHIRLYRNSNVHHGVESNDPTTICYQLQRYFRTLVYFYLRNASLFSTQEEANSFLDLPTNSKLLDRKKKLVMMAIKFHSET